MGEVDGNYLCLQAVKTTIISAIYDEYDTPKPILGQDGIDVDWVFVSDSLATADTAMRLGWRVVVEPREHIHPNRAAKTPKCLPWLYCDTDTSIWIDGSFKVVSRTFAKDVLEYANPIAQFKHPWRNCCYDEVEECIAIPKYAQEALENQSRWLSIMGHPKMFGLWATGVIARHHSPEVMRMGFDWLRDIYTWSYQDQVSQPNNLRLHGLYPNNLPGTHLANQWLAYQGSGRHSHG